MRLRTVTLSFSLAVLGMACGGQTGPREGDRSGAEVGEPTGGGNAAGGHSTSGNPGGDGTHAGGSSVSAGGTGNTDAISNAGGNPGTSTTEGGGTTAGSPSTSTTLGGGMPTSPGTGGSAAAAGGGPGVGGSGDAVGHPTSCPSQWWGSDVTGVKGTAVCGDAYDRAQLVYGEMVIDDCVKLTGPAKVSQDGNNTECCYTMDENACGNAWVGDYCVTLENFGGGAGEVDLHTIASPNAGAACASSGTVVPYSTQAEAISMLVGVWMRCEGTEQFGGYTPFDGPASDGVVFDADGTFHGITRRADGTLEHTQGCNEEGLWGFIEQNQLNLHTSAGENMTFPVFESAPSRLVLDWMGVAHFVFAKVELPIGWASF